MGRAKLTAAFMRQVHRAAAKHTALQIQLGEAMTERYGCTHSDVDCDELIETLDIGNGDAPTLAEADAAMADCGKLPLSKLDKEGSDDAQ